LGEEAGERLERGAHRMMENAGLDAGGARRAGTSRAVGCDRCFQCWYRCGAPLAHPPTGCRGVLKPGTAGADIRA
jgi:hypothetical protein